MQDFLERRKTDRFVNLTSVELVRENVFDILTVPKDDTAEFGYAALDQMAIMQKADQAVSAGLLCKVFFADRQQCYTAV